MKKALTIAFLISLFSITSLQAQELVSKRGAHQHEGLFISFAAGPAFGDIREDGVDIYGKDAFIFSGTGAYIDVKIGGQIYKNLILHGTLISAPIFGPKIKLESTGKEPEVGSIMTFGDALTAVGLTYYFMPVNIFLSGSAGFGRFVASDNGFSSTTDFGLGYQVKAGKEFWVSANWGVGIGLAYSRTFVDGIETRFSSERYSVMLNVTFD